MRFDRKEIKNKSFSIVRNNYKELFLASALMIFGSFLYLYDTMSRIQTFAHPRPYHATEYGIGFFGFISTVLILVGSYYASYKIFELVTGEKRTEPFKNSAAMIQAVADSLILLALIFIATIIITPLLILPIISGYIASNAMVALIALSVIVLVIAGFIYISIRFSLYIPVAIDMHANFISKKKYPNVILGESLKISWELTRGKVWNIFVLNLSLLGWYLLTVVTVYLASIFTIPYYSTIQIKLYEHLYKLQEYDRNTAETTKLEPSGTAVEKPENSE